MAHDIPCEVVVCFWGRCGEVQVDLFLNNWSLLCNAGTACTGPQLALPSLFFFSSFSFFRPLLLHVMSAGGLALVDSSLGRPVGNWSKDLLHTPGYLCLFFDSPAKNYEDSSIYCKDCIKYHCVTLTGLNIVHVFSDRYSFHKIQSKF